MQDIFEIKDEFKAVIVGFNKSGLPLGDRQDLHLLAEMALHNPGLRKYFVQFPSAEAIRDFKEGKFLEEHPAEIEAPELEALAPAVEPVTEQLETPQANVIEETPVIDETTDHIL